MEKNRIFLHILKIFLTFIGVCFSSAYLIKHVWISYAQASVPLSLWHDIIVVIALGYLYVFGICILVSVIFGIKGKKSIMIISAAYLIISGILGSVVYIDEKSREVECRAFNNQLHSRQSYYPLCSPCYRICY